MSDEPQPTPQGTPHVAGDAAATPEPSAAPSMPEPSAASPMPVAHEAADAQTGLPEGWVAVPPPNPYAEQVRRPGRALAITAMTIGLIAILTAVVSVFYGKVFAAAGAGSALLAIALGIGALAQRQRPLPAGLTGLIGGALALIVTFTFGGLLDGSGFVPAPTPPAASEDGSNGEATPETPPEGDGTAIVWPANMSSGGVFFSGGLDPVRSDALTPGTAPTPREVHRESGPADIQLYVDYRCPHCVDFETANAATLEEVVSSGAASLEIRPMSFVSPFSASLTGALACVVDRQPESTWKAHVAMLDRRTQNISTPKQLADELDAVTGGLSPEARSCIETDEFTLFAQALNSWFGANPVPNAVDPTLRVNSTPTAVVNGVPYPGDPASTSEFRAFLVEQGVLAG